MSVSFIGNALGGTTTTTSFSITLPTTQAGDILILEFTHRGTGDGTIAGTSVTTGGLTWTLKHDQLYASSAFSGLTYWTRATGNHSGQTVTGASLTNSCAAIVTQYRGAVSSGDPLTAATIVGEQNASGQETQAQITTTVDGAWLVLVVANSPDVAVTVPLFGAAEPLQARAEILSTGGTDTSIYHASNPKIPSTAGATGQFQWTQTDGASGSWAYAIKPDTSPTVEQNTGSIDSYAVINQDSLRAMSVGSALTGYGQAFTGDGNIIDKAIFSLLKNTTATGNGVVKIYAHSGTYGTSSVGTGAALATSDVFDVSTLTTAFQLITFNFTGGNRITLANGTNYVAMFEWTPSGAERIDVGRDNSSATHDGIAVDLTSGSFSTSVGDAIFYILDDPITTSDTTPTLDFTGTDADTNPIEYQAQIDTVNTFDSQAAAVIDSLSESTQDSDFSIGAGVTYQGTGQSFTGDGNTLGSIKFYLKKTGSPTGNATVEIYAHDGGTYGGTGLPTGVALATASATLDVSSLTTSYALKEFLFTGANQIVLGNGTNYFVTIKYSGGDASNTILVGVDGSGVHPGRNTRWNSSVWSNFGAVDECFYVYSLAAPLLNKVSETDAGFVNPDSTTYAESMASDPSTGSKLGSATWNAGGYLQLNPATDFTDGEFEYTGDLVRSFNCSFDFFTGGGDGADSSYLYWGASATVEAETQTSGNYAVVLNEFADLVELRFNGTVISSVAFASLDNSTWRNVDVICAGNNIKVYVGDVLQINYTDITRTMGGTKFGLGARSGSTNNEHRVRNFTLTTETSPFPSGDNIQYTVQAGDELDPDTYYWRVRGKDPAGTNTYGAWSSTRSFTITGGAANTSNFFQFF